MHALICIAVVFLNAYNQTYSFLPHALQKLLYDLHKGNWELIPAMSQKCTEAVKGEIPKCSHEPRPAFVCSIHARSQEPSRLAPAPGKQQVFGEAVPLPSIPMATGGTVPASLQPLWPASGRALVLLSPVFTVKRVFARGKSIFYHRQV